MHVPIGVLTSRFVYANETEAHTHTRAHTPDPVPIALHSSSLRTTIYAPSREFSDTDTDTESEYIYFPPRNFPQIPPLTLCNTLAPLSLSVSIYLCLSIARAVSFDNPRQSEAFNQVRGCLFFPSTVLHFSP